LMGFLGARFVSFREILEVIVRGVPVQFLPELEIP